MMDDSKAVRSDRSMSDQTAASDGASDGTSVGTADDDALGYQFGTTLGVLCLMEVSNRMSARKLILSSDLPMQQRSDLHLALLTDLLMVL